MTDCLACGRVHARIRLAEPNAPTKVAMVDANALARLVQTSVGLDGVLDILAKSPRYVRCTRCGALTRIGDYAETLIPGPVEPPAAARRVVVVNLGRGPFDELWRGARAFVAVQLDLDVLVGDMLRVVETYDAEQRDPVDPPRFILGLVTSRDVVGIPGAILSLRVIERGTEERGIESRRARLVAALAESGAHVASAAMLLGISVAEAYRWVHELGLTDKIQRYKPRSRTRRRAS